MPNKSSISYIKGVFKNVFCTMLFIIGILYGVTSVVMSLDRTKQVTQYTLEQWTDENGLPQNSIFAILQTSDGYIWLATEEGVVRFDGVTFTVFDSSNTTAITKPNARCLFEDSQKNLWIGTTGGGVLLYKNNTFTSFNEKDGLSSMVIRGIQEDKGGNIWIGTDGGGVCRLNTKNNKISVFTVKDGLPDNEIKSLYFDSRGNLWMGTPKGLCLFKNNRFITYNLDGDNNSATAIYEDSKKNLWVGTMGSLYLFQNNEFIKQGNGIDINGMEFNCLFEDTGQNLWLATRDHGLIRFQNGVLARLDNQNAFAENWILSVKEDREGSLWVGTSANGLYRLKDDKFSAITNREGLPDNIVFSVFEDSRGYIWMGTNSGLCRYKDGVLTSFTTRDGLSHNVVDTITEDQEGNIWVGTDKGLNKLRHTENGIVKLKEYLADQYIPAILQDGTGQVWAGTLVGAFKINDTKPELFSTAQGLATPFVNLIHEDRQGNLWFSTLRGGIAKCAKAKDGKVTGFTTKQGLAADSLNCVYEDQSGTLWWGSNNGVSRFAKDTFFSFNERHGLFNDNVYRILEDAQGNLWMSSNKGIFRVRKGDLNALADGKLDNIKNIKSMAYGKEDGMRSSECNGGYQGAGCKTRDGRLWFPTMKGVVVIDPQRIKTNRVVPPVHIEKVLLDGVAADLGQPIVIQPGTKRLELHYTALSFFVAKNVKFKYRLEGYDEDWLDAGTRRAAWYTNLDGGTYSFQVIACNDDGLWNLTGTAITIKVIPPIWKTWWFILLALLLFAFFSYVIIHLFSKYITMASFWKKQKFIGKFKLLDKIGSGGMGTIYKANNMMDKKETVALKVLREDLFGDENNRKRFKQEAAIIDQLDHPNIIKIFERGQAGQTLFIAMELLVGKTLADKITEAKKLDLMESLHIMVQMADAMAKIHSKSIIHRDLKPENIMLITKDGNDNFVKLLDFGLAKMQHQTRLTQTGVVIGTISYMSPEQISGKGSTAASDVYALGIIFYEMITGSKPFFGETTIDIMKQIMDKIPIEPIRFRYDISFELNRLIMWMLEKKPEDRPQIDVILKQLRITYNDIKSLGNPPES